MSLAATESAEPIPAFELRGVTVVSLRDASKVVLEDVNWTVEVNDFWAVAGLLRSGKSDLMALAAGISRPTRGVQHLFGKELVASFEQERLALRLRIGLVFDGGQLLYHLTLAENIALPLRYHLGDTSGIEERLRSLMEFTGLEPWANSRPADVNRNWQQRIGLARALALKPEILLLDSPLTGLDPRDLGWWLVTMDALATGHPIMDGKPLTLVVTGDDFRPWRNHARQFAVLKQQQFLTLGSRSDLASHGEPLLQDLLSLESGSMSGRT